MQLTNNFWLNEFTRSATAEAKGIDNTPTEQHKMALQALCVATLQPIRELINVPMIVTSGYRGRLLNIEVGGSETSQHAKGEACDFIVEGIGKVGMMRVAERIRDSIIPFDQLIFEDDGDSVWIHISYKRIGENRRECLTARFNNGEASYEVGINM